MNSEEPAPTYVKGDNMRLKLIACKVLTRELSYLSAISKNYVDTTFIRRDYHDFPEKLNVLLQKEIDKIDRGEDDYTHREQDNQNVFDAILIGYGLCSNVIVGLSSQKYPIVVPKAHDCITLYLGSKERYRKEFDTRKGIYWYNKGWMENSSMPSKERYQKLYEDYIEKYGKDNAAFLMETEQDWLKEYENGIYITQDRYDETEEREKAKEWITFLNWKYSELQGDNRLLSDFIEGNWTEDNFLIVPPKQKIAASFDENIIKLKDEV